jgi:hypothetical protein
MMTNSRSISYLTGLLIFIKISYLLFSMLLGRFAYLEQDYGFDLNSYAEMAMRKDAFWYQGITQDGYPAVDSSEDDGALLDFSTGQSAWAFFPGYPVFNRVVMDVLAVDYHLAAFINALLFSFAGIIGFFLFCKDYWQDTEKAFFSALVLFVFPFHFYFSMFLTEAPFFAFLIWSCYAIQRKKSLLLSLLLIPLVVIRPNGLVLLLPLGLYYLAQNQVPLFQSLRYRKTYQGVVLFLPALVGFTAYCFYQKMMTGYYFAFSEAQQGWGKTFMFPLFALFKSGNANAQFTSCYVVVVSLFAIIYRNKLPFSLNLMIVVSMLLPLTAGSTYSMIRYMSVVFPLFMVVSDLLYRVSYRKLALASLFILQLASFYLWLADYPLGF